MTGKSLKIGILGLYHMGETYSACLAELGYRVIGIDEDKRVVDNLNKGIVPLKEPQLDEILKRNLKKGNLHYSVDFKLLNECNVAWITIDTPFNKEGHGDFSGVLAYVKKAICNLKKGGLIIVSSQLPVGTSEKIIKMISEFDYAYIPENLRLGEAVDSFIHPTRIIIGVNNFKRDVEILSIFREIKTNFLVMDTVSAEMVKHATNAFLATSLSFIADIADLCERVGADILEVSHGLRADGRIGEKAYLDVGLGFSGGHLERELQYLLKKAKSKGINLPVIKSVLKKNEKRIGLVYKRIIPYLKTLKGKTISFFGITYKSGTPTLIGSLPLRLASETARLGAKINLCDPLAEKPDKFNFFVDPYKSAKSSHVIICTTPWKELRKLNFKRLAKLMVEPKIFFDARNFFAGFEDEIEKAGMKYIGVGR
jgi:UDPglucose 6-dehydrogenase